MRHIPHLVKRANHYYFRIAVPLHLVQHMGRKEILQSLKTKDYAEAVTRCSAPAFAVQEVFKEAHKGKEIANFYLGECLNRLDFQHDSFNTRSTLLAKLSVPVNITDTEGFAHKGKEETVSEVFKRYIAECQRLSVS